MHITETAASSFASHVAVASSSDPLWLSGQFIFLEHVVLSQASGGLQAEGSLLLACMGLKSSFTCRVCQGFVGWGEE